MFLRPLTLVALACLVAAPTAHAQVRIDDFSDNPDYLLEADGFTNPGPLTVFDSRLTSAAVGGERDVRLRELDVFGAVDAIIGYNGPNDNSIIYGNGPNRGDGLIQYDGLDNSDALGFGLGGVNLTAGGADSIAFDITTDIGAPIVVTVYTDAANYSTFTFQAPATPGQPRQTLSQLFTAGTATGTGATFTNVNAITLLIDGSGNSGLDVRLANFGTIVTTVPEPGSLALLTGMGTMGAAFLRRRKMAHKVA